MIKKIYKFIPFLILLLLTLVLFKDTVIKAKLPIPSDAIVGLYHPYIDFFANQYPHGYPFKNFLITDPLRQQYPWREIAVNIEKSLQLPLWNPYNGAGEPLLGNIQSASLYPLNILFFVLPFTYAWTLLIILQPMLAGLFLYFYLRNLKIAKTASLFGSIAFALSGFNTTWLEWGTIVQTGMWLSLILLSIDKIFSNFNVLKNSKFKIQNLKLWIINYKWHWLYLISLSCSLLAGHLQIFFYVFVFSFIYFLARWLQHGKTKRVLLTYLIINILFLIITA
ncbi:MAG TPA: hypothetical protein VMR41_03735, partial [Patescibacteria group bacterium]|nr:hypothetical protein [Patescibacteria group bacterium]